jgi:hypothetical protein
MMCFFSVCGTQLKHPLCSCLLLWCHYLRCRMFLTLQRKSQYHSREINFQGFFCHLLMRDHEMLAVTWHQSVASQLFVDSFFVV